MVLHISKLTYPPQISAANWPLVFPEHPSYSIPNINTHVGALPEMGKPLRLRHSRYRIHNLLAVSILLGSRL
jgi:hypothetical protein